MIPWAKMASDLDLDPAIIRAGRNGREVYLFLLRRCALTGSGRSLTVDHIEPSYLASSLMFSEEDATDGVAGCLNTSLVEVKDERVFIRSRSEVEGRASRRGHDGYVWTYVIRRRPGGEIKIGKSFSPAARLSSLQTGSVDELVMIRAIRGDFESELHGKLDKHRIRGEWFLSACLMDLHLMLDDMEKR